MTENLSPVEATERYPELKDRIQSTFIDLLLIIVLMYFFARVIENFEPVPNWIRAGLFALLFILYEPLCMTLGCTLGNYIKQIRVRQHADTSKRINFFQALIRYPIKVALGWVSFLTIGSDPQRRAIHDMASGSVMLKIS
jgi:uncharacterized RDD family membrane protein YckC